MDRAALEEMVREELVVEARRVGVKRPEVMTRVELVDEVLRLGTPNPVERKQVRGWLGVARDLLASAVEVGLNLPDAAAMIRGEVRFEPLRPEQPPVATVTLAEIYGAQGHFDRAIGMLDEVLDREADHDIARRLRNRLNTERDAKRSKPPLTPVSPEPAALEEDEPELATLVPMKPDAATFFEEEPELATLVPMKPDTAGLFDDEPDHVTLIPARPDTTELDVADEAATLFPPRPAEQEDEHPSAPPEEPSEDDSDLPTIPPASETALVVTRRATEARVYFELGELADARGEAVVLRVVEHRARASGVERVERDLRLSGPRGTATVVDLQSGSVLRAALGRKWDGRFRAVAVGAEVVVAPGGVDIAWAPRRNVDYTAVAGRSGLSTFIEAE
jgi:hypothetical protein